jgi:hypothetical protein
MMTRRTWRQTRNRLLAVLLATGLVLLPSASCNKGDNGEESEGEEQAQEQEQHIPRANERVEDMPPVERGQATWQDPDLAPNTEALRALRGMQDILRNYYERDHYLPDGTPINRLPVSAPLTPATVPCGEPTPVTAETWSHPTWRALRFDPTDPVRYSYQFDSYGTHIGATFTISAFGDIDCDGTYSTFQRMGTTTSPTDFVGTMEPVMVNPDE